VSTTLRYEPALSRPDLLAGTVLAALRDLGDAAGQVLVAEIDPELADTTYAACIVAATTRADVNNLVRRHLGARKASFAPVADVTAAASMEYGGITPVGLPAGWPVLVDAGVAKTDSVVIGSGIRGSKLRLPGPMLAELPGAQVLDGLGIPVHE
jgi:prolyl-tRNA editing enzyme YbaK/EbsC (Cys-tRNA(Pro) deacylase)